MAKKSVKKSQLKAPNSVNDADKCAWTAELVDDQQYGEGVSREYLITTPSPKVVLSRKISTKETGLIAVLLITALFVRCRDLESPNSVVFDEVHFGGFAAKYAKNKFFMDVHPPLAKMMFAAVSILGGFTGDFTFEKIGDVYPETVPYVLMRAFPALLSVGTVLLCYLTLRNSGVRPLVSFITAGLLVVENSQVTLSRYILLDSPLMFFIASAIYTFKKFENQIPFTLNWFRSLIACGIALGLALSSKWVGLFTVAWVGIGCLYQLWFIIGDLSVSSKKVFQHFLFRGVILLGIPIALYITFFAIHFQLLVNEDDGSAFMSSAFRSTLNGNKVPKDLLAPVGLGSVVSIRHVNTFGGYLHSHNHFYETGSKQQQITLYPHIDTNNEWRIEPYNDTMPDTFVPLEDGMKIRLVHVNTNRRLHSHDEKPPVSERDWQKEASCYGFDGFEGDANDDFVVEIVDYQSAEGEAQKNVRALETVFRLRHAMTGGYLFSSEVKLPSWGFEQQEVTTASQGLRSLTHWHIEYNKNDLIPEEEREYINYPTPSLMQKLVEIHKRMWKINQGLTEHHHWQSDPSSWPVLLRGINYWVRNHTQVYLLGNAIVWWASSISIVIFIVHAVFSVLRWQLGANVSSDKNVYNFNQQAFSYVVGWILHYIPFFLMGRQLFLHHYVPAAYFGLLTLGHIFEILVGYFAAKYTILRKLSYGALFAFLGASVVFFVMYSPLIYAKPWTSDKCQSSKLISTWDFDCNAFLKNIEDYKSLQSSAVSSTDSALQPSVTEQKEAIETIYVPEEETVENVEELQSQAKEGSEQEPSHIEELVPPVVGELEGTKQE